MERDRIQEQLIRDEGLRLKPYTDTVGKLTIGVGRNLNDFGITQSEALYLLNNDIDRTDLDLRARLPWYELLDDARQASMLNMGFNMGITRFMKFKNALARAAERDFDGASVEFLDSIWAEQVGDRALRVAGQFRDGVWR
jgi:lysozyme